MFGISLFSSANKINENILNSALRKKNIVESKKKITFKQSNSLKGTEDDEETGGQAIINNSEEDYSNGGQNLPLETYKADYCEEDDDIIKSQCSKFIISGTQQDTHLNQNNNCLAPRNFPFSAFSVSGNFPNFQSNQIQSPSLVTEDVSIQLKGRNNSAQGNNFSQSHSSPYIAFQVIEVYRIWNHLKFQWMKNLLDLKIKFQKELIEERNRLYLYLNSEKMLKQICTQKKSNNDFYLKKNDQQNEDLNQLTYQEALNQFIEEELL